MVNPEFAKTLEVIRDNPEDFYTGELAKQIVEDVTAAGGLFFYKSPETLPEDIPCKIIFIRGVKQLKKRRARFFLFFIFFYFSDFFVGFFIYNSVRDFF